MAHFAKINDNNIVENVLVVPDEQEHRGQEYLNELGLDGTWIQTSYNANIRGKFAGIGDEYISDLDVFRPVKPFESWTWNETDQQWDAPVETPEYDSETHHVSWNEETGSWDIIENNI